MKYLILIAVAFIGAVSALGSEYDRVCRTAEMSPRVKASFQVPAVSFINIAIELVNWNNIAPQYLGTWYETKRYEAANQTAIDCSIARYTLNVDGSVQVANSGYAPGGQFIEFIGRAVVAFPEQSPLPAKLLVAFVPGRKFFFFINFPSTYQLFF